MIGVLTLLILLGVGSAYAKVEYVDSATIPLVTNYCGKGDGKYGDILVITQENPCLTHMEEAMRAMEPWLGYTYKDDTNPNDFKHAKELFYQVKHECWGKP